MRTYEKHEFSKEMLKPADKEQPDLFAEAQKLADETFRLEQIEHQRWVKANLKNEKI